MPGESFFDHQEGERTLSSLYKPDLDAINQSSAPELEDAIDQAYEADNPELALFLIGFLAAKSCLSPIHFNENYADAYDKLQDMKRVLGEQLPSIISSEKKQSPNLAALDLISGGLRPETATWLAEQREKEEEGFRRQQLALGPLGRAGHRH